MEREDIMLKCLINQVFIKIYYINKNLELSVQDPISKKYRLSYLDGLGDNDEPIVKKMPKRNFYINDSI